MKGGGVSLIYCLFNVRLGFSFSISKENNLCFFKQLSDLKPSNQLGNISVWYVQFYRLFPLVSHQNYCGWDYIFSNRDPSSSS